MEYLLMHKEAGFIGNSPIFWRKGGNGYTQWIDEAEKFSEEKADEIISNTKGSHNFKKMSWEYIKSISKRTIGIQDVNLMEDTSE